MKTFLGALVASIFSGIYWWLVFVTVYARTLFVGDRSPTAQPEPDGEVLVRALAIILVAVLAYAMLVLSWRRLAARAR